MNKFLLGTAIVSAALATSMSSGTAATLDDVMAQLQSMQRDNQAIRRDNEAMRKELAALRPNNAQAARQAAIPANGPSRALPQNVSTAMAADLPASGEYYKSAPIGGSYNWSGLYAGLNAGFASGRATVFDPDFGSGETDHSGFLGGAQIGYNGQFSSFVLGIEADVQGAAVGGSSITNILGGNVAFVQSTTKLDAFGTVRGRIGYAFDRALIYGTGGFAAGHTSVTNPVTLIGPPSTFLDRTDSAINTGWAAGGGIEYGFLDRWSAKAEYLHIEFDSKAFTNAGVTTDYKLDLVRAGVNYRF